MIRNVVKGYFDSITSILNEYGVVVETKYSSDVSLISEYTKSYKFRTIFGDTNLINQEDRTKIDSAPNFSLIMYNRSPFKKWEEMGNNVSMQIEATTKENVDKWLTLVNNTVDIPMIQIRNIMYGKIELTCKMLTSNTSTMEVLEFVMENEVFRKNKPIDVIIDLGDDIEPIEMEYNTLHADIDEFGFIDSRLYGDLQQLSFSVTIHGMFFSMFKQNTSLHSESELTIDYIF